MKRAFDALGDASRRAVLLRLRGGGLSVGEIAEGMEVSRPAVSQHLKILKAARLVSVHAVGTRRVSRGNPTRASSSHGISAPTGSLTRP
jgi:DNA-binding transcriptional ArsR family regulator